MTFFYILFSFEYFANSGKLEMRKKNKNEEQFNCKGTEKNNVKKIIKNPIKNSRVVFIIFIFI